MNKTIISILIIILIILVIIVVSLSGTKNSSKKQLSNEELNDYIVDLWVNYEENTEYTKEQLVVISLTAYDSEINNGGLCQFFSNSSRVFAPLISDSLEQIKATKHKELFDKFIKDNKIDLKKLDSFETDNVDEFIDQYDDYPFDEFDSEYYQLESMTNLIINYAKDHYKEIIKENKND